MLNNTIIHDIMYTDIFKSRYAYKMNWMILCQSIFIPRENIFTLGLSFMQSRREVMIVKSFWLGELHDIYEHFVDAGAYVSVLAGWCSFKIRPAHSHRSIDHTLIHLLN